MGDDLKKLMRSALADYEAAGVAGSEGARAMREGLNRIEELERENQLQAQEIDKTRARADKWQGMVIDCEKYLKPGETPRHRMDRDHADVLALMKLLEKEKHRAESAEAKLAKAVGALGQCLDLLDDLVAESGRSVEWGEEDAFRMGEWFEKHELEQIAKARAALTELGEGDDG